MKIYGIHEECKEPQRILRVLFIETSQLIIPLNNAQLIQSEWKRL